MMAGQGPVVVLLVHGDAADCEIIADNLGSAYALRCAHSAREARDLTQHLRVDGVLLADDLPDADALSLLEFFVGADHPTVFICTSDDETRASRAIDRGALDYLTRQRLDPTRVRTTVRLAIERKLAEREIKTQQQRLSQILEGLPIGVHVVGPGETSVFSNALARRMLGLEAGVQERFIAGTDTPYPEADLPWVRAMAGETSTVQDIEVSIDGKRHELEILGSPILDEDGSVRYAVTAVLDETDHRRLERQLTQAQKMEAVGRLAGGVAHDFNNLLTAIFSFGTFVLDELDEEDAHYDDIQEIMKAAGRAEELTRQLLAFSRRQTVVPQVVNLNDLVRSVNKMLDRLLGEDISLESGLAEALRNVEIDPGVFEQVLVNLAVNARDAMPGGGKLIIETESAVIDEDYSRDKPAVVPPGDYVMVAVTDDGSGMEESIQQQVFEPFFTTKAPGTGTGLGLSTCYGIVKQAGGFIWVYSEPGFGTTFKIYLPVSTAAVEEQVESNPPTIPRGNETILITEDDPQVRALAARSLTIAGYSVVTAADGPEALEAIKGPAAGAELLLCDVIMPGMSAREVAQAVAAESPTTKVLFMSGYTQNAIANRGVLDEGVALISKPFTPKSLVRRVRQVLDSSSHLAREVQRRPRVLVVDDEPPFLRALERAHKGEFEVTTAHSAKVALQLLLIRDFDVIVCDLAMPDMNGRELYDQIKIRWPHLAERVAFMTGVSQPTAEEKLRGLDAPLLHKPARSFELREVVDRLRRQN